MRFANDEAHTVWAVKYPLNIDDKELTQILPVENEETADARVAYWDLLGIKSKKVFRTVSGWLTEDAPKGVTVEDLDAAPVGARAITADERLIQKTPAGWVVTGWIAKVAIHPDYEEVSSETAMSLSPLYLIGEYK